MALAIGTKVIYSSTYAGVVTGYGTGAHLQVQLTGNHRGVNAMQINGLPCKGDNRVVFVNPDALIVLGDRGLTDDEIQLMKHISMFGSTGYPVRKVGSKHWTWDFRSLNAPVVWKTKREATGSFERYHAILLDAYAGRL